MLDRGLVVFFIIVFFFALAIRFIGNRLSKESKQAGKIRRSVVYKGLECVADVTAAIIGIIVTVDFFFHIYVTFIA